MTEESLLSKHQNHILFEVYEDEGERYVHFSGYFQRAPFSIRERNPLWIPYDIHNSDILLSELVKRNIEAEDYRHFTGIFPEAFERETPPLSVEEAEQRLSYLLESRSVLEFFEITENTPVGEYYSVQNSFKRHTLKPFSIEPKTTTECNIVWAIEDLKTGELFSQNGKAVLFPKEKSAQLVMHTLNRKALRVQEFENYTQTITR